MQRTRLASVSYLNALPFNWGLSHGSCRDLVDLALAPPAECARLLGEGLVDVALIPSIELARISGLASVPGTGIASRHEVRSVLLISLRPPEAIRSLAVDLNSRTSVALSRLILARRYGCRPRFEAMPPAVGPMLEHHDAALLIGDAALKASLREDLITMDLAREWNEMTGMPFVFAVWACRPVVRPGGMKEVLERSLDEGMAQIDRIAVEESVPTGLPAAAISAYLRENIHFRLGPRESDSLRMFFTMCREEGILPGAGARAVREAGRPCP